MASANAFLISLVDPADIGCLEALFRKVPCSVGKEALSGSDVDAGRGGSGPGALRLPVRGVCAASAATPVSSSGSAPIASIHSLRVDFMASPCEEVVFTAP